MIILLHSSKSMRTPGLAGKAERPPELLSQAQKLGEYLKTLTPTALAKTMHVSATLADKTHALIAGWNTDPAEQSLAIDSFVGDIYSGLRPAELSASERDYADQHLRILSGLYGILRPYDGIRPYRLEMGYKLPRKQFASLYTFWGEQIAKTVPTTGPIINLSSVEYSQVVTKYVEPSRLVTPTFLTVDPKTNEPKFVAVHAKIARGAFARWLITSRTTDIAKLREFTDLGYRYAPSQSTPEIPVFICKEFGGLGLSIRLQAPRPSSHTE